MKSKRQHQMNSLPKSTNIEWILNLLECFPKHELQQRNMRPVQIKQFLRISELDQIIYGAFYTFVSSLGKFAMRDFILYPNMLVLLPSKEVEGKRQIVIENKLKVNKSLDESTLQNSEFLSLSSVTLEKRTIQYKESQANGLVLHNSLGNTYLFFETYVHQIHWFKNLKKFCKLTNFLNKFTVRGKQDIPNHYTCIKNNKNKVYTVQIYKLKDLYKNYPLYECLMNEINLLTCFKKKLFLQLRAIYEDQQNFYIVYEYWTGNTLFKLIQQGVKFSQQQIAQVMYQVIKAIKFLHHNDLYHGYITPNSIILLNSNLNQIKCTITNLSFREGNKNNWFWLLNQLPTQWIPPEFSILYQPHQTEFSQLPTNEKLVKFNPLKIDMYQIGCVLYFLTFYTPSLRQKYNSFNQVIEGFEIKYSNLEKKLEKSYNNGGILDKEGNLFCQSQLQLLITLMIPDPSLRGTINEIHKHQWFINQKAKKAVTMQKDKKLSTSLRTILEIREQNSFDIQSSRVVGDKFNICQSISESVVDFDEYDENDNLHRISKEHCMVSNYLIYLNSYSVANRNVKKGEQFLQKVLGSNIDL